MSGVILPWSSTLKFSIAEFFIENTVTLSLFGLSFILVGVSLVIYTFINTRRRYYFVRTGNQAVLVNHTVVCQYLEAYWKTQFPEAPVYFKVTIKRKSIEIVAELPALPLEDQRRVLEKIKDDLENLFGHTLGYSYDVHLYASFNQSKS